SRKTAPAITPLANPRSHVHRCFVPVKGYGARRSIGGASGSATCDNSCPPVRRIDCLRFRDSLLGTVGRGDAGRLLRQWQPAGLPHRVGGGLSWGLDWLQSSPHLVSRAVVSWRCVGTMLPSA